MRPHARTIAHPTNRGARSSGEIPLPDNGRCRSCRSSRWLGVSSPSPDRASAQTFIGRESDRLVVCDAPKPRFLPVDAAACLTASVAASVAPDVVEDHRVRHPARSGVGDRVAGALHSGGHGQALSKVASISGIKAIPRAIRCHRAFRGLVWWAQGDDIAAPEPRITHALPPHQCITASPSPSLVATSPMV